MHPLLKPLSLFAAARSARQQRQSALWDPAHWSATANPSGHLEFDGVDLSSVVSNSGSPLLAVSLAALSADASEFRDAVRSWMPDSLIACSYKTNCIPGVLREMHAAGFGAEVISPYELWLAEKLGVPGDRIIVNGVNKDVEFLESAVRVNAASINIDEPAEIELLVAVCRRLQLKARVSLRLKVDPGSHFGLAIRNGEAMRAASAIAAGSDCLEFAGLHFHALADNDDPEPHVDFARRALQFAAEAYRKFGLTTRVLNVGGGYAVPTTKVLSRFEYARQRLLDVPARPPAPAAGPGISRYMQRLAEAIVDACRLHALPRPRLVFEPGRILFSRSHVLLTRVHSIKPNPAGPDYAMTDAGKILVAYPCDYEYHQIFVANRMRAACTSNYHLMGRLCTAADWLAKNRCLPALARGDVLAVMDAGAYFTSYSSNFAFPRPGIVMLDRGNVKPLRRPESFEHLVAMDEA